MADVCASCKQRLVLDPEDAASLDPDDLLLSCGCHFHWQVPPPQCLMDEATQVAASALCPSCGAALAATVSSSSSAAASSSPSFQIFARYASEGGVQDNFDIYPTVAEEAYLEAHPSHQPARAFLTMCAAGDVYGIVDLLGAADGEDADDADDDMEDAADAQPLSPDQIVRYQDPLNGLVSGLHAAVLSDQPVVALLLLYLASPLPLDRFPASIAAGETILSDLQALASRVPRLPAAAASPAADIRLLRNARGETAEVLASQRGGPWAELVQAGVFAA